MIISNNFKHKLHYAFDITIASATAPTPATRRLKSSRNAYAAASDKFLEKHRKYENESWLPNIHFEPIVFEALGPMWPESRNIFNYLCRMALTGK